MRISKNEYRTWTPGPWTPSWTRTMDYPCGPPLIFEDKFYQKSKQVLGTLKWTKLSSALIIRVMGSSYLPWSQRFFLIFLRERDQEQAAKRRQRVAKATRREKNLLLPWPRISLSCRRQGQDLILGRWLVDIFSNTQTNLIGSFNCNYRGVAEDFAPHFWR